MEIDKKKTSLKDKIVNKFFNKKEKPNNDAQPSLQTFSDGLGNQTTVNVVDSSGKLKSDAAIQADIKAKIPASEREEGKRFDQVSNNAIKSALTEKRPEVKLFKSAVQTKIVTQTKAVKR